MLIGRADVPLGDLAELPNVHVLGPRPYAEIPSYGAGFDVAVMPWLDNDWIRYANPIKLKEYLALGLPVVTTRFAEADRYRDLIAIADSPDDFVAAIAATLAGQGTSTALKRRASVTDAPGTVARHAGAACGTLGSDGPALAFRAPRRSRKRDPV